MTFLAPSLIGSHLILIRPFGILVESFVLLHLIKEPDKWVRLYTSFSCACSFVWWLCLHTKLCFYQNVQIQCPDSGLSLLPVALFFCITPKWCPYLLCGHGGCGSTQTTKKYWHQVFLRKNASSETSSMQRFGTPLSSVSSWDGGNPITSGGVWGPSVIRAYAFAQECSETNVGHQKPCHAEVRANGQRQGVTRR